MRFKPSIVVKSVAALVVIGVYLLFVVTTDKAIECPYRLPSRSSTTADRQPLKHGPNDGNDSILDAAGNVSMKVKLIILTYMRSGSSFTGDLLNHHPEVFYVYEPLWATEKYILGQPMFFLNKQPVYPDPRNFYYPTSRATENLKAFLDCNFYSIDLRTLGQYHLQHSLTTSLYYACQKKYPGIAGAIRCLPIMFQSCRRAAVTSVKTIRFTMAQAEHLLKNDPLVKVVHLIRDPRATLHSQSHVGEFKLQDLANASKAFCKRVLDDLKRGDRVSTLYPGRTLRARYEDLATEPVEFAERLLAFSGLAMDDVLRQYVRNITSAGLPDSCAICTTRSDSRKTAMRWRYRVNLKNSILIDVNCKDVYKQMGYLPFHAQQDLLNLTLPSFVDASKVSGLWK